ncbi:MAG: 2OG-Fe(II) oxygenase [Gammaproteobacteria bacterium]
MNPDSDLRDIENVYRDPALERYIDPAHLTREALAAYRARLDESESGPLVLDDFLKPDVFGRIAAAFEEDLLPERVFALIEVGKVSEKRWDAASPSERFYSDLDLSKPRPGHEMAPGFLRHLLLINALGVSGFLNWFSYLSGCHLRSVEAVARAADPLRGDSVAWHTDASNQRALCVVVYMHRVWDTGRGGRFFYKNRAGKLHHSDPLPNRALVFRARTAFQHRVEPMDPAAGDALRYNYTWWFRTEPAESGAGTTRPGFSGEQTGRATNTADRV